MKRVVSGWWLVVGVIVVACGLWPVAGWAVGDGSISLGPVTTVPSEGGSFDWKWLLVTVVPAVGGVIWRELYGSPYWERRSRKEKLLATIVQRAVAFVYLNYVRGWKEKATDGKLSSEQRGQAMRAAVEMVKGEVKMEKLEPLLATPGAGVGVVSDAKVVGMVQAEVAKTKAECDDGKEARPRMRAGHRV